MFSTVITGKSMTPNIGSCATSSPLSKKQRIIWSMITKGLSVAAIAEKLEKSRQYVNQTKIASERKLSMNLMEMARVNDIDVIEFYPQKAILVGYHPILKRKAVITYTVSHGVKMWFWYDNPEEESNPALLKRARIYLIDLAREHGLSIQNSENIHPAKLAEIVFSKLMSEETP